MADVITFVAAVYKVQTLAKDGGVRVSLDLPETAIMEMAQLAECQRFGIALRISAVPEKQVVAGDQTRSLATRTKRKSEWKTAKEPDTN